MIWGTSSDVDARKIKDFKASPPQGAAGNGLAFEFDQVAMMKNACLNAEEVQNAEKYPTPVVDKKPCEKSRLGDFGRNRHTP